MTTLDTKSHGDPITTLLLCTEKDLSTFRKKVAKGEERVTDQDLTGVIDCLVRRERALETHLRKRLTEDQKYRMPKEWIDAIKVQIDFFQKDTSARAKVESVASQQGAFYGLLSKIDDVIQKPMEVMVRPPTRVKLDVSKTETGEDLDASG